MFKVFEKIAICQLGESFEELKKKYGLHKKANITDLPAVVLAEKLSADILAKLMGCRFFGNHFDALRWKDKEIYLSINHQQWDITLSCLTGKWSRDIGYGVPAQCDLPKCSEEIDRGLSYVCGSEPYGGEFGCGLYFCPEHFNYRKPRGATDSVQLCPRCFAYKQPFKPKADIAEWIEHKLTDESWQVWRDENPQAVEEMKISLEKSKEPLKI